MKRRRGEQVIFPSRGSPTEKLQRKLLDFQLAAAPVVNTAAAGMKEHAQEKRKRVISSPPQWASESQRTRGRP